MNEEKQRRIVCAAMRAFDGTVLLGIRHYSDDMHKQIHERRDSSKFCHRLGGDQGFVDQHGVYLNNEEAYKVAEAAGQIKYPDACSKGPNGMRLHSEGLY